jgi:hypothetical protein
MPVTKKATSTAAVLIAAASLFPPVATAQVAGPWQYGLSLYGWLPTISGTTVFPPPATGGSDVELDADAILDALKFTFMGTFEAHNGAWGGFTDFVYMDLGATKSRTRDLTIGGRDLPADVTAKATFDLKSYVWTLAGEYRIVGGSDATLDVVAGARMLRLEQTLDWTLTGNLGAIALPDRDGNRSATLTNWDAIVGVKGRFTFGADRRWFVPYYADIGTGESDLTYQLMTGVGYAFQWGELVAQWRYLDYDLDGSIQSLTVNGPAVAVNFRW